MAFPNGTLVRINTVLYPDLELADRREFDIIEGVRSNQFFFHPSNEEMARHRDSFITNRKMFEKKWTKNIVPLGKLLILVENGQVNILTTYTSMVVYRHTPYNIKEKYQLDHQVYVGLMEMVVNIVHQ